MDNATTAGEAALRLAAEVAIGYRRSVADPDQPAARPYGDLLAAFDEPTPGDGLAAPAVVAELVARSTPGLRATTGPRFFGWVIGGSHPVAVAADWLTAAWGQNAGNHVAAPAAAAVEAVAARWLLDLLDLPRAASVGFVTGATVANVVCLAAARGSVLRQVGWDVENDGLFSAPPITVLIGDGAHATVFSALQFLGLGYNRVVRIATDAAGRIRPAAFAAAAAACTGPVIAIVQAGQLNTGAFDPMADIMPAARACGAWVHVDGAFGLWARASPSHAHFAAGFDQADSWAVDGQKWLQVPYDCGYAVVRDAEAHRRAMTTAASYLPLTADDERDPSHFVPELSRRARGFATWAMIRHLGRAGVAAMVAEHCRLATHLARRLAAEPGVHIVNDVELNQVLVRFGSPGSAPAADRLTAETIARIQSHGACFVGGAQWRDRWVMRLSLISAAMTEAEIDLAADVICAAWRSVRGAGTG